MEITAPVLAGRFVRLEPLAEEHREGLRVAADDDRVWEHMTVLGRGPRVRSVVRRCTRPARRRQARVPFAVRLLATGELVGSYELHRSGSRAQARRDRLDVVPARSVGHGGESRVQAAPARRTPSRRSASIASRSSPICGTRARRPRSPSSGAVREGVMRSHAITADGRVRDSVLFAITSSDWPAVKARLIERLAGY